MYFTKIMLLVAFGMFSLYGVHAQGDYVISGNAKIGGNGDIKVNFNAQKVGGGVGTTVLPPGVGTTLGPSAVPGLGSKSANSDAVQRGLNKHNEYRQIHEAPAMELSSELNSDAQTYASYLASNSLFEHDPNRNNQGENLGLQCAPGSDGDLVEKVVKAWYDEVCDYNFNSPGFSGGTGHFTQVVWKGSTQLGVGHARGTYQGFENCIYVVGRYREPGNMMGDFPENVKAGSYNQASTCSNKDKEKAGKRNKLSMKKMIKAKKSKKENADKRILQLVL